MSGIYIKGIKMPKDGKLPCWVVIHSDGTVEYNKNNGQGWQTSEAVPVPDHGRLIDADALEKEHMKRAYENFRSYQFHVSATAWINEAPTIIPADEEGEK